MSDDMPEQPKTVQLPAVPQWAAELMKKVTDGFTAAEEHFDRQDATLDKVVNESIAANTRMTQAEEAIEELRSRAGKTSIAVRGGSQADAAHEAKLALAMSQLADERARRETLERNAVTRDGVKAVVQEATAAQTVALVSEISQNKKVRAIAALLAALAFGWLSRVAMTQPAPVAQPISSSAISAPIGR